MDFKKTWADESEKKVFDQIWPFRHRDQRSFSQAYTCHDSLLSTSGTSTAPSSSSQVDQEFHLPFLLSWDVINRGLVDPKALWLAFKIF